MTVAVWYLVIAYIGGGQTMIRMPNEYQCAAQARIYQRGMHGVAGVYCLPGVRPDESHIFGF